MLLTLGIAFAALGQADGIAPAPLKEASSPIYLSPVGASPGIDAFCRQVRNAKIVGLGEASHGSHEFAELKTRLIKRLVEKEGCRVVAFESGFVQSLGMTLYVAGSIQDLDAALANQGYWTWQTQEVKQLLDWLKNWNQTKPAKDRVLLVGMDVQESAVALNHLGILLQEAGSSLVKDDPMVFIRQRDDAPAARIKAIMDEVRKCEPGLSARLGPDAPLLLELLERSLPMYFQQNHLVNLQEDLYDKRPGREEIEKAQKRASALLKDGQSVSPTLKPGLMALTNGLPNPDPGQLDAAVKELEGLREFEMAGVLRFISTVLWLQKDNPFTHRDGSMAGVLAWLSEKRPGAKVAVWAHNSHVMSFSSPAPQLLKTMGASLKEKMGNRFHALGFCFSNGDSRAYTKEGELTVQRLAPPQSGSWEEAFSTLGHEGFFLPVASAPKKLRPFLEEARPMRQIGANYSLEAEASYWRTVRLRDHFDSVIYVKTVSAAKLLAPSQG